MVIQAEIRKRGGLISLGDVERLIESGDPPDFSLQAPSPNAPEKPPFSLLRFRMAVTSSLKGSERLATKMLCESLLSS